MDGDEYPTFGDFQQEEAEEQERIALFQPVHAFSNGSHYGWWIENNCDECKWGWINHEPQYLCPIQRTFDKASCFDGMVTPWIMHVAGIDDNKGQCRVKEAK